MTPLERVLADRGVLEELGSDDLLSVAYELLDTVDLVRGVFEAIGEALAHGSFTCDEADLLHGAMVAVGATAEADGFMVAHAESDTDDEDRHEPVGEGVTMSWRHRP